MKITLQDEFHTVTIENNEAVPNVMNWLCLFGQAIRGLGFANYEFEFIEKEEKP